MLTLEALLIQETGHLLDWDSRAGQASSLSMAHPLHFDIPSLPAGLSQKVMLRELVVTKSISYVGFTKAPRKLRTCLASAFCAS